MARTRNQRLFDQLGARVASGQSLRAACKALKVPERTGKLWATDPDFKKLVAELSAAIAGRIVAKARDNAARAADKLGKILKDVDPESPVALRAIRQATNDFLAIHQALNPGAAAGQAAAPGVVVPGLDARWEKEGGGT